VSLFARVQEQAAPIRERILAHPFVRGLGDGSLAPERFQFYMRQDYLFLIEYCRVLALAVARSDDLGTAARFADLLSLTLNVEMELHRQACFSAGVAPEELEETSPAPATAAYTDHLRRIAETQDLAAIVTAILPCAHGYWEIGVALRARGLPDVAAYADWIRMYTSDEYEAIARWLAALLDRLGEDLPEFRRAELGEIMLRSTRYEYLFWESAWRMEGWSV
jgi:thiaminase (transcriptional activator TenA)